MDFIVRMRYGKGSDTRWYGPFSDLFELHALFREVYGHLMRVPEGVDIELYQEQFRRNGKIQPAEEFPFLLRRDAEVREMQRAKALLPGFRGTLRQLPQGSKIQRRVQ